MAICVKTKFDLLALDGKYRIILFLYSGTDDFQPTWREIGEILRIVTPKQTELEQSMLNKNCLLSLNAVFVQRICKCNDNASLLSLSLSWMENLKIRFVYSFCFE